jgi:phosphoribosylglycinamide formyltransferase 1
VPDGAFPLARRARLAVFASGRGSNLSALLDAFPPTGTDTDAQVALVLSDRSKAGALARARAADVPAHAVPYALRPDGAPDRARFEDDAQALLDRYGVDLVLLAGFMRLLSPDFTARWSGRLLNVHPSLLPAFPGLHAVAQALAAGVSHTGCTVHFVDAGMDTGPVVLQRTVRVLPGDDERTLQARVQEQEHLAYPAAVRAVLHGVTRP